ncbi:hypothetical protein [Halioxenophilus aromaticivorans]|uniref:Small EDRK-rich factor-like N-terminal domain-containing protein n=1 Tax=Halioxenophilus aromaticivorans TaxID=1306992 RepID=A0AAV3TY27_9ALTE
MTADNFARCQKAYNLKNQNSSDVNQKARNEQNDVRKKKGEASNREYLAKGKEKKAPATPEQSAMKHLVLQ